MTGKIKRQTIAVITLLVVLVVVSCLDFNCASSQETLNSTSDASSSFSTQATPSLSVKEHKITEVELAKYMSGAGVYQQGQNYNQKVNGYGTGLCPPTTEGLMSIAENVRIIDSVSLLSLKASSFVDNSATPWFPPIGNQASEGACVAWAVGYYVKTYQEAKEHSWDLSGATWVGGYLGHPTASYQDKIMSPDFIYHLINNGVDDGSSIVDAIDLIGNVGVSSWLKTPYDPTDSSTWPSEEAWMEAPLYRGNSTFGYQYIYANTDEGVSNVKSLLADGNLVLIGVDANQFSNMTSQDIMTIDNYDAGVVNHANTIVGYDDGVSYVENGTTCYGAFKVANSWGVSGWEYVADGFYWISYNCMKQLSVPDVSDNNPCILYQDLIGYQPELLAAFKVDHDFRSDCNIVFGLGTVSSPLATKNFHDYVSGGAFPFCSNNIVFDITEFKSEITSQSSYPFYMRVYDKGLPSGSSATGNVTFFGVGSANSSQAPVPTVNNHYVTLTLTYWAAPPTVVVSPTSGPPLGAVTLAGFGFTEGSSLNISYLNPLTSTWIPISTVVATDGTFSYNTSAPDLEQNNPAGDLPAQFNNIFFRVQDGDQSVNTTVPYTEGCRGLSQVGSVVAAGLFGNNTDLSESAFVSNDESVVVSGMWFSPGNVSLLLDDSISLSNVTVDENGFLNTTVVMPTVAVGKHVLVIREGGMDLCVNITRLPKIWNDYSSEWHDLDFNIIFEHDFSGIDMFYKINNGPVENVSFNGQPRITVESGDNQLEFWGIWDIYGTGSMEIYHVVLSDVKLDKSAPTGSIACSSYTNSPSVTLGLSGVDLLSGVLEMRFSNDNSTWSEWEPYAASKIWTLQSGDEGVKSVFVQYKDHVGFTSIFYNTSTIVDTTVPVANAGQSQTVTQGNTVWFDASGSFDGSGLVSYVWDFGDGAHGSGMSASHVYLSSGSFVATLTVTDLAGNTAADTVSIIIQPQPTPTPTLTPSPTPTQTPMPTQISTPAPSSTPSASTPSPKPNPVLSISRMSLSQSFTIVLAAIVIGAIIIGVVVRRKKRAQTL